MKECTRNSSWICVRSSLRTYTRSRAILISQCSPKDIYKVEGHPDLTVLAEEELDVKNPEGWIHIKLRVEGTPTPTTTTLAVRKHNLYVMGFMNQKGKWFQLSDVSLFNAATKLEDFGVEYGSLMKLIDPDQVRNTLKNTRLGKAFVERAVRRLSCYDEDDVEDEHPTRLGLVGLIVLISEAARFDPIFECFIGGWNNNETTLTDELVPFIWNWKNISAALLRWHKSSRTQWDDRCISGSADEALNKVRLVLNTNKKVEGDKAQVEIFAVSANFHVVGIKVLSDHGTTSISIYDQDKQERPENPGGLKEAMVPLVLKKVLPIGISGYKWFEFEVYFYPTPAATKIDSIKMKWDCRKQHVRGATELVTRNITLLVPERKIGVTYLVMSGATKANVEVKLGLKGDPAEDNAPMLDYVADKDAGSQKQAKKGRGFKKHAKEDTGSGYTAHGKIEARIDGFKDHKILLFSPAPKGENIPRKLTLPMQRSAIQVPSGKRLHIDMAGLRITDASGKQVAEKTGSVSFDFGSSTPGIDDTAQDDTQVEVNVTWPTLRKTIQVQPHEVCSIGDRQAFTDFIDRLRSKRDSPMGVSDGSTSDNFPLLLPKPCAGPPAHWIHIKLQTMAGDEWTTLAMRDDKFYGVGFTNKSGVWYDLGMKLPSEDIYKKILPAEYNSVLLRWSVNYKVILKADDWDKSVVSKLDTAKLGKDFATKAVHMLSRYPDVEDDPQINPRLALLGLMIMVCESAKLEPLRKAFADAWDSGTEFTKELVDYIRNWGGHVAISAALEE